MDIHELQEKVDQLQDELTDFKNLMDDPDAYMKLEGGVWDGHIVPIGKLPIELPEGSYSFNGTWRLKMANCVGGPFDGQRMAPGSLGEESYRSGGHDGYYDHNMVWVSQRGKHHDSSNRH